MEGDLSNGLLRDFTKLCGIEEAVLDFSYIKYLYKPHQIF